MNALCIFFGSLGIAICIVDLIIFMYLLGTWSIHDHPLEPWFWGLMAVAFLLLFVARGLYFFVERERVVTRTKKKAENKDAADNKAVQDYFLQKMAQQKAKQPKKPEPPPKP